jgi:hypothetical protein
VEFDNAIDAVSFTFENLYSSGYGEVGQWTLYNDGVQVAQSTFTESGSGSGSGTIDLSGYGSFDQIVFSGVLQSDGSDGSDFTIKEVSFSGVASAAVYDDWIDARCRRSFRWARC